MASLINTLPKAIDLQKIEHLTIPIFKQIFFGIWDKSNLYFLGYSIISLLQYQNPFVNVILLFDIFIENPVFKTFYQNYKQLLMTLYLGLIIILCLSTYQFLYIQGTYGKFGPDDSMYLTYDSTLL